MAKTQENRLGISILKMAKGLAIAGEVLLFTACAGSGSGIESDKPIKRIELTVYLGSPQSPSDLKNDVWITQVDHIQEKNTSAIKEWKP